MVLGNHCKFQWFWSNHCKFSMVFEETITIECFLAVWPLPPMVFQWFLILLPSLSMVFDGSGPLVKRCDGFDGSLWSRLGCLCDNLENLFLQEYEVIGGLVFNKDSKEENKPPMVVEQQRWTENLEETGVHLFLIYCSTLIYTLPLSHTYGSDSPGWEFWPKCGPFFEKSRAFVWPNLMRYFWFFNWSWSIVSLRP